MFTAILAYDYQKDEVVWVVLAFDFGAAFATGVSKWCIKRKPRVLSKRLWLITAIIANLISVLIALTVMFLFVIATYIMVGFAGISKDANFFNSEMKRAILMGSFLTSFTHLFWSSLKLTISCLKFYRKV